MTSNIETIAAIATPTGRGGIGIIRVSGPLVLNIAKQLLPVLPRPRMAEYLAFEYNAQPIDTGLALFFPAPNSFTGEDVLELQGHGGSVVMDMLLNAVISCGARLARPGEFSERAYLNDKIDLAQAEAIADLIDSASEQAARAALRSLQGEFSSKIQTLLQQLIHLRVYVEAAIDFPEEEIDFLADKQIVEQLNQVEDSLQQILQRAEQGMLLREGLVIVIAGRPNVGKSTLINALSGEDSAIVTPIAGTTRDVIRVNINLEGVSLHIIDTAGLRDSNDPVELEGIKRAWAEIEKADHILYLLDASIGMQADDSDILSTLKSTLCPIQLVYNKADLVSAKIAHEGLLLSAKSGLGMDKLKALLLKNAGKQVSGEGQFIARRRHVDALQRALSNLVEGKRQLFDHAAGELLAEELRRAQQALGEITGEFSSDDLLGEIFSSFCIGK